MRRSAGLFVTAASALSARAFLIPAELDLGGHHVAAASFDSSSIGNPATNHAIQLHCPSCAFSSKYTNTDAIEGGDNQYGIHGGPNSLVLDFTISEDGERLQVNGEPIYPLHLSEGEASPHVHVSQIPSSSSIDAFRAGDVKSTPLEVTGSLVKVEDVTAGPDGGLLIPLTYSIVELERQTMTVDGVTIWMLKTADGELSIMHVGVGSAMADDFSPISHRPDILSIEDSPVNNVHVPAPPPASGMNKPCSMLPAPLCRLRLMIQSRIMEIKQGDFAGCARRKASEHGTYRGQLPGHIRPHFLRPGPDDGPSRHAGRPHHGRPYASHHHRFRRHRHHRHHFVHAFARGVAAVLIPTLAGIAVGMAVSLLGLFVGRLISFVWINLVRGGPRGYHSVSLEDGDPDKILVTADDMEPPPVYEEAPAYEEVVAESR